MRAFVETIDAYGKSLGDLLRHAWIEIVRALRFHLGILRNFGFVGRPSEFADSALQYCYQRRWREIARITGVQRCPFPRLINYVDPRTQLILIRERVHHVKAATEINRELLKRFPFVLQIKPIVIPILIMIIEDP